MTTTKLGSDLYLDLLKKILTNTIYEDGTLRHEILGLPSAEHSSAVRAGGGDWPVVAHTMIGRTRLDNVHECLDRVVADGVPGDFIETGVWRGGTCIFVRGYFEANDIRDRRVWLADSFEGLPEVTGESHQFDQDIKLHTHNDVLAVSLAEVRRNFERYGLLDEQVEFLPGFFEDTLPQAPIEQLAVLRLDGDLYQSTLDALTNLYPKLAPGGFVIVDDYVLPGCKEAIHDYRARHGIEDKLEPIDLYSVYWRRAE
ncbi:O-methyltransferase/demethyldecarbamoylnovobiocin O-methyltransferase/8-demethyl-8-(2,3-dimethoxy-alpha-L-rhamnosyl)tetracenomycin-C 4'-O-methyltransferase [Nocardia tenerifensis]|uniref:O-methyltransferase/demethyldecarbamoylnovobiocin O-methyltransferase/8-demethyl-8-(2, 3-dimethoxy-alpha-L-rhamnosyl)tetracenomycin-C 4'-O-methyltransferase n=1 Tax=Nocardia tenerifensis TaxID=228006 RepID=A0A318K4Z5_9NOCA|nr:TylF/MycF family methyltransferase [Nocardia tenerifensis]PXX58043.1 O-methyltransferase/demethyldecarbamoylnovobiocin O-methyltransferase/8-demethyl-8-(2,3-dimethoxy-alpha-L-rhamnosyl)tetracenomycin-C 4'-O-methyltransferase [Nocardia tenerifensis]